MLPRALLRADQGARAHRRARERRRSDEARRESRRAASHIVTIDLEQCSLCGGRCFRRVGRICRARWAHVCDGRASQPGTVPCSGSAAAGRAHVRSRKSMSTAPAIVRAHHLSERNIPRRCSAVCTPLTLRGGGYRAGGLKWPTRAPRFLVRSMKGSSSLSDLTMFSTVFNIVQRAAAHGPAHHSGSRRNSCARWEAWW